MPLLYEAALALQVVEPDALPLGFNHAFLCCLPKKPSGEHPDVGTYYAHSATLPLSIVNTDVWLMAGAYRCMFEPIANEYVSAAQQGFITGRSMLANIVDINFESMRVSLNRSRGAAVLFDF